MRYAVVLLALGCGGSRELELGDLVVVVDKREGTFTLQTEAGLPLLEEARVLAGTGSADVEMQFGSFKFTHEERDVTASRGFGRLRGRDAPYVLEVEDGGGDWLGDLVLSRQGDAVLLDWAPAAASDRVGLSARCTADDHFLGLGAHAQDTDHVGEAFALWVSEPGIGKTDGEILPEDWFFTGTRHATSLPVPFVLRPHLGTGLVLDTVGRVDVDLCASDPDRFELLAWHSGALSVLLPVGDEPMDVVRTVAGLTGTPELPPPWVFGPWNDAIRGSDRVREVADRLRAFEAPATAVWTEDWKGAVQTAFGYHLRGEWTLDTELYPDAVALADELEDDGLKWLAYFSPFLIEGTTAWDEALADGVLVRGPDGEPSTFFGATMELTGLLDLSTAPGRDWALERMAAVLDVGFDGWMADYAEWLPTDAVLANGASGLDAHNRYPLWWQEVNAQAIRGTDASFFVRSGWLGTASLVPVVWGGDQRTSFDADDGFPSVIPMGLGLAASGVPVFTHDVAGYQSVGNDPSDAELWFRWAWLGAFTPILRTHHGAFDTDNWQFDSDDATTEHWARVAREHMRLFPYRYGLAAQAARDGTPMLRPVSFVHGGGDWGRTDAWMLGDALLVAPVLERGATGREVELPEGPTWFDWWTGQPASSGFVPADVDAIPVFAAGGTTVPTFADPPDTLVEGAVGVRTLEDADDHRVVYLFGGGGPFSEADGTTYTPSGQPSGSGSVTQTLTEGRVDVAGVTVEVRGPRERAYTFEVVAR